MDPTYVKFVPRTRIGLGQTRTCSQLAQSHESATFRLLHLTAGLSFAQVTLKTTWQRNLVRSASSGNSSVTVLPALRKIRATYT